VTVQNESLWKQLKSLASGYSLEAFAFVQEGLRFTVDRLASISGNAEPEIRHVTGQELCLGLREYAIDQYGFLARTVLNSWGVYETADFGRIVFAMVNAGVLKKSDEDRAEDFDGIYDFEEVFSARALELC